ncbi:hypothetical protein PHLGIDRAFT_223972 [Phlebiopsis gigantea 11061_1 CR5-6]|uniref:Uncharacterized protein n=1 Tax=Phlebiopsis gigantea (strain 11061_1 CR5-6) TaxID=745531 RepID=A0A0C3NGH2_PHLG1|nr:hypothetical protein PHLGIDRAFT_223972 [Phlebiopsis gigantea 11061_1 CR5-6]
MPAPEEPNKTDPGAGSITIDRTTPMVPQTTSRTKLEGKVVPAHLYRISRNTANRVLYCSPYKRVGNPSRELEEKALQFKRRRGSCGISITDNAGYLHDGSVMIAGGGVFTVGGSQGGNGSGRNDRLEWNGEGGGNAQNGSVTSANGGSGMADAGQNGVSQSVNTVGRSGGQA